MMNQQIKVLTVTDLHQDRSRVDQLESAVQKHAPDIVAFVGDFLDFNELVPNSYNVSDLTRKFSSLKAKEKLFLKGNHDFPKMDEFAEAWYILGGKPLNVLDRGVFTFGPLKIIGFPCLLGNWHEDVDLCAEPEKWLPSLLRAHGPAARTLWLMHEPPQGTTLSEDQGVMSGNGQWTEMVDRFQPRLVVFGHDHDTPRKRKAWHCQTDSGSTCINVGQSSSLHFCVLTFDFPSSTPSLPSRLTARAYPDGGTLSIPNA